MGELSLPFEIISLCVLVAILVADLVLVSRRPHVPSAKECALWIGFYVTLALVFAGVIWGIGGPQPAVEFVAGWLTEYSLSVDNLFVFILIMSRFAVPRKYQQEVLMVGIIIALIARAAFIMVGAVAIEHLSWIFYLFGVFLLYTAFKQVKGEDDDDSENGLQRALRRVIPVTEEYDGNKLRTRIDGKRMFTPMLLVFVTIGLTDVMFAIDSIPAIFGITQSPFIVFTANLFALMGLRQLYFLLGGLMDRLVYLHFGIAAILAFIGVKLIFHAMHESPLWPADSAFGHFVHDYVPEIGTIASLCVIIGAMAIATIASLLSGKRPAPAQDGNGGRVGTPHAHDGSEDGGAAASPVAGAERTVGGDSDASGGDHDPYGPTRS
ncbi:TerC family protein [Brachybacterium sp. AOP25-B2-12]|uniref:TerC family protein n=1 Tax=Brachybacterium sp. AOP25-B2-12 TaxID=3457710 RepID=UPI004033423F